MLCIKQLNFVFQGQPYHAQPIFKSWLSFPMMHVHLLQTVTAKIKKQKREVTQPCCKLCLYRQELASWRMCTKLLSVSVLMSESESSDNVFSSDDWTWSGFAVPWLIIDFATTFTYFFTLESSSAIAFSRSGICTQLTRCSFSPVQKCVLRAPQRFFPAYSDVQHSLKFPARVVPTPKLRSIDVIDAPAISIPIWFLYAHAF